MATWTYLSNLTLILQTGQQDCCLYANGRNSVQVVVTFDPLDEHLQPIDVPSIGWGSQTTLIDYVTASELSYNGSSGWCYSDNSDQPYNAIPLGPTMSAVREKTGQQTVIESSGSGTEAAKLATAGAQYYAWISCYPDARSTKAIGIRIRTAAGNVYYAALYEQPDQEGIVAQKISITPLTPINYDTTSTTLDFDVGVARDGDTWRQDNYYFYVNQQAVNGHQFIRVEYVYPNEYFMGPKYSYCGGSGQNGVGTDCLFYQLCWPLGSVPDDTTFPDVNVTLQLINSRGPNALTFTVLSYVHPPASSWTYDNSFTIYDQYGNKGDFHPTWTSDFSEVGVADGHWS